MLYAFREVDVSTWEEVDFEPRGKRAKRWVRAPDGSVWLRKQPRDTRPSEPAVEVLALAIARAVGIDAAEAVLCRWRVPGSPDEQRGIVVRRFTNESADEVLALATELLAACIPDYDPERHCLHTLASVRAVLERLERHSPASFLQPFARMIAFDAWIGNSDRHQENWGVVHANGRPSRLAPLFDPAASLGVELQSGHQLLGDGADLGRYVLRCRSGFGDGQHKKPLLSQGDVVELASKWPEWQAGISDWLAAFSAELDSINEATQCIPQAWLAPERRVLACRLLRARLAWLCQTCRMQPSPGCS